MRYVRGVVVVMEGTASQADVDGVVAVVTDVGGSAFVSRGVTRTIVGLVGDIALFQTLNLGALPGVREVIRISQPFKLVSRESHPEPSTVLVGGVPIGPRTATLIAGPCAVETPEQTLAAAEMAKRAGATLLRGGAYKPRTSPYAFQGLGEAGLRILADVREQVGLPVVTEVVEAAADVIQIGTRNMQNFSLLKRVGQARKPVLLKRGMSATLEEWLMAAEYVMAGGNYQVMLCERGVRTFSDHSRNTLDLSVIPPAKKVSHLPILVDPSHGTGRREFVPPMALAALAAGADGILVEIHPDPARAQSDGAQSLDFAGTEKLLGQLRQLAGLLGRAM